MISLNRDEIEALIDHDLAAEAVAEAYRATSLGKVNLPPVGHIAFPDHAGDCHIKYGHVAGDPFFVIKIATGFPGNEALGQPNGNGLSVVMSAETGEVRALLHDEMVMTDIRTGIGGAIATKLLARKSSLKITVVGSGVQARRQIESHASLMSEDLIFKIWGRSVDKTAAAVKAVPETINVSQVTDLEDACRNADVIVTATGSTSPLIQSDWVQPGTHITAVGADALGKQELESEVVVSADALFADLASQSLDHGEFAIPAANHLIDTNRIVEIGDVLANPGCGKSSDDHVTVADLTGIAAQDIAIAGVVLNAFMATV